MLLPVTFFCYDWLLLQPGQHCSSLNQLSCNLKPAAAAPAKLAEQRTATFPLQQQVKKKEREEKSPKVATWQKKRKKRSSHENNDFLVLSFSFFLCFASSFFSIYLRPFFQHNFSFLFLFGLLFTTFDLEKQKNKIVQK